MEIDEMLLGAIKDGIRKGITEQLTRSYKNPLDAIIEKAVKSQAERVKKVAKELSAAKCPRAGTDDRGRAERLLDMTAKAMDAHDAECRLADANLAAMAFGKTYLRN